MSWTEADITINGQKLTAAQAMTIRVALGSFALSLQSDGLGDDEHGAAMTEGYLTAIRDIHTLMSVT